MSGIRVRIDPRDVPAAKAARLLGVDLATFEAKLAELLVRGFPGPDPTTGNYDTKAIQIWMDRRSGLVGAAAQVARDAAEGFHERLRAMT